MNIVIEKTPFAVKLPVFVLLCCLTGFATAQDPTAGPALNAPAENTTSLDELYADNDLVLFAGDAIELEVPRGWKVAELPGPREIKLMLSPGLAAPGPNNRDDAAWLCYHWKNRSLAPAELENMLAARIRATTGRELPLSDISSEPIAGLPSLSREFTANGYRGKHWLVPTSWGAVEIHLTAPEQVFAQRLEAVRGMFRTMQIGEPDAFARKIHPAVREASEAVGYWKSLRGRIRLAADGRVVVRADDQREYAIDEAGNLDYQRKVPQLSGRYRAEGDLLLITFDDGSLLNYRWTIQDGELLLTDHHGRVSQLRRHFD